MAMKTPGVYIVEKDAFPGSVVEVATAVPAFIGHTEKAILNGKSLLKKSVRISSLAEYISFFGEGPKTKFKFEKIKKTAPKSGPKAKKADEEKPAPEVETAEKVEGIDINSEKYLIAPQEKDYSFFNAIRLFFENGGGSCHIISVGDYETPYSMKLMSDGLAELEREQEPTIVVIPEVVKLDFNSCITMQQAVLKHCNKMKNRVAIVDIHDGYKARMPDFDPVDNFRGALGVNYLDYSMAYYPWLETNIVPDNAITYENVHKGSILSLVELLKSEMITPLAKEVSDLVAKHDQATKDGKEIDKEELGRIAKINARIAVHQTYLDQLSGEAKDVNTKGSGEKGAMTATDKADLNKALLQLSPGYKQVLTEIREQRNLLPPAAAMAGVFTRVDQEKGVWKAPANVSLSSVKCPAVDITHEEQEDLNVTPAGKSINAIRSFLGEGTLVWGARTLDGNSLDWRYIQVRRTIIMLEESIKLASRAYVFENNVANTWVTMKGMISNFLFSIWKRGGLAGTSPDSAYRVSVGLGETMTPTDILEGILRITVKVALVRPAEFIEITFQQQMQES